MRVCRFHRCRAFILAAVAVNVVVLVYLAFAQHSQNDNKEKSKIAQKSFQDPYVQHVESISDHSRVTIIIREFEEFENEIVNTFKQINIIFKDTMVVVIGDKPLYPPLTESSSFGDQLQFVSLQPSLWKNVSLSRPESFLQTEFVLIVPDATQLSDSTVFKKLIHILLKNNSTVLAVPIQAANAVCAPIAFDYKKWILEFLSSEKPDICNNVVGEHALFMKTKTLLELSQPYLRPMPLSLYIQGYLKRWSVTIDTSISLTTLREMYKSDVHNQWKHKHEHKQRLDKMYRALGIKLVIQESGRREWYGCMKDSERCFDTVVDDMPEYLHQGRWTPPCCLKALRQTSKHVFDILDSCEARYWLEGGSLLGAARTGDIIPWDYDVDVGIYLEDVKQCDYLRQCSHGQYVDERGYVWEKAREGDFYRVQYSETNRLHVDIFPFFSRNGTMTKNTWMKTHRQDTEFPEHFLKPLTKVKFAGIEVKAPNNIKAFLEFKFGTGVIENPKYPNSQNPL